MKIYSLSLNIIFGWTQCTRLSNSTLYKDFFKSQDFKNRTSEQINNRLLKMRAAYIVVLVLGLAACSQSESDDSAGCKTRAMLMRRSPDGKHVAYLNYRACAGGFGGGSEDYQIVLKDVISEDIDTIFDSITNKAPDFAWDGPSALTVSTNTIDAVSISKRMSDGVNVYYFLKSDLTRQEFFKTLADYKYRMTVGINKGAVDFSGKNKNDNIKIMNGYIEKETAQYERFSRWVSSVDASPNR